MTILKGVLLGYTVAKSDKEMNLHEIDVSINLQPLTTVKGIQRALGHFGWYKDIMEVYATPTIPLT